jgi:hypothetical protein
MSTMPTVECILLASSGMPLALRRSFPITVAAVLLLASPLLARDPDPWTAPPNIRVESPDLRSLINEAAQRSPVVRQLIDEIERADITVYIRARRFAELDLDGRVGILSTIAHHRYLVVELACGRTELVQMATLGHELHHVLEIVREPSVVDARSLAAHYERIGVRVGGPIGTKTFETAAAREAGTQVRRELLVKVTRSTNGS